MIFAASWTVLVRTPPHNPAAKPRGHPLLRVRLCRVVRWHSRFPRDRWAHHKETVGRTRVQMSETLVKEMACEEMKVERKKRRDATKGSHQTSRRDADGARGSKRKKGGARKASRHVSRARNGGGAEGRQGAGATNEMGGKSRRRGGTGAAIQGRRATAARRSGGGGKWREKPQRESRQDEEWDKVESAFEPRGE